LVNKRSFVGLSFLGVGLLASGVSWAHEPRLPEKTTGKPEKPPQVEEEQAVEKEQEAIDVTVRVEKPGHEAAS
jgi:hypothetical protein